jgi:hypothetical protein
MRIPLSSILCTFPHQHNLFNLIVSVIVGFLYILHKFLYWLIFSYFIFYCHTLGLKFFYTLSFQKYLFVCYLSLLVSRYLMRILKFCLLLCSLVLILVF